MQTAIPDRLTERKYEQNDQKYPISPRESKKRSIPNFLQQREVQRVKFAIKQHMSHSSKTWVV